MFTAIKRFLDHSAWRSLHRHIRVSIRAKVASATMLLAISLVVFIVAVPAGTHNNYTGQKIREAIYLASEIRAWTIRLPFCDPDPEQQNNPPGSDEGNPQIFVDDLDDLMAAAFSPPRDRYGSAITDMPGWSQQLTLTWLSPSNPSAIVAPGTSDIVHIAAVIAHNDKQVLTTSWVVIR